MGDITARRTFTVESRRTAAPPGLPSPSWVAPPSELPALFDLVLPKGSTLTQIQLALSTLRAPG